MGRLSDAASAFIELPMRVWKDLGQIKDGLLDLDLSGRLIDRFGSLLYSATLGAALNGLAADDPDDQITGAAWMVFWSFWTTLFSGGFTAVAILFWLVFLFIGVLRYSDDGEEAWETIQPDWDVSLPGAGVFSKPKKYATRSKRGED